jgi:hypothetical protein
MVREWYIERKSRENVANRWKGRGSIKNSKFKRKKIEKAFVVGMINQIQTGMPHLFIEFLLLN